jgi:hypothetical protein
LGTAQHGRSFRRPRPGTLINVERPDLYQDDLTEERQPSPAKRDDVAGSQTLDPDLPDEDDAPAERSS